MRYLILALILTACGQKPVTTSLPCFSTWESMLSPQVFAAGDDDGTFAPDDCTVAPEEVAGSCQGANDTTVTYVQNGTIKCQYYAIKVSNGIPSLGGE